MGTNVDFGDGNFQKGLSSHKDNAHVSHDCDETAVIYNIFPTPILLAARRFFHSFTYVV